MLGDIKPIDYSSVTQFVNLGHREQVSFTNNDNCSWFGIFDNDKLVSFYCLMTNKNNARFKSNYTLKEYRRQGCLKRFIKHSFDICKQKNIKKMTAFCTEMSIGSHTRNGAKIIRFNPKNKVYFVSYNLGE